jgi:hypothetical protein
VLDVFKLVGIALLGKIVICGDLVLGKALLTLQLVRPNIILIIINIKYSLISLLYIAAPQSALFKVC